MQNILSANKIARDYYGLKLLASLAILLTILAYSSFYLIQNFYSNSFLDTGFGGKKVYFLRSSSLKNLYSKYKMNYNDYEIRLKYFKELTLKHGYNAEDIQSEKLKELPKNAKLIVLDAMSLSSAEIKDTTLFVENGGKIIFNFTSGFLDDSLQYQDVNLVNSITGLELDNDIESIKYDQDSNSDNSHLTMKLLSPISKYIVGGEGLNIITYDPLPVFNNNIGLNTDAYMTTWAQNNYAMVSQTKQLTKEQSGLMWHGYKEKGKWVYFSFPGYVFIGSSQELYSKVFRGMLEYLENDIIPVSYPFIDSKNAVFVSEDTEFKFESFQQFHDIAEKNNFPVTAFCVASLAEKFDELMKEVSKSDLIEFGSHSFNHKKIVGESDEVYKLETIGSKTVVDKLSKRSIVGYRAPREEVDDKMIQLLQDGGFKYILGAAENRLLPHMNDQMMIIPRHGTDDYAYLINLDWDASQILEQMIKEVNVLVDLNAMYTLSTHTHLITFSSNVNIVDDFLQYVNKQEHMTPMSGEMIYKRIKQNMDLSLKVVQTARKVILTIDNYNQEAIKNMHYEIFVDPNMKLTGIQAEIMGVETDLKQVGYDKYTLILKSIEPQSQLVLFIDYEKNI